MYPLNETELQVLWDYLKEMLESGKISPSKSPAAAPIIFVPKAHSQGLGLCIDYHGSEQSHHRKSIPTADYVGTTRQG
jgi:hypothetical protein